MVMGSAFEDDQEVIRFQKNHGTVSPESNLKLFFHQLGQLNNTDFAS